LHAADDETVYLAIPGWKVCAMTLTTLVFYGSYRRDRAGIRLARYLVEELASRGHVAELIDAREVGLPMLDRMFKEYPPGEAPPVMAALAAKIRKADAFVFVTGEYNWGMQPGLKNLTDHYLEEWFWRPAAIASYSGGRLAGTRSSFAWHNTLSEMGMVVTSSTLTVGQVSQALDAEGKPTGDGGQALARAFPRFAADLEWWASAAKRQHEAVAPPY
jgi:NAD(P)H-dependent FMN reductase